MRLDELMTDGNYLPEFMRDYHAQKDVFKRIDEIVQARREKNIQNNDTLPDMGLVRWIDAQIYVVDFFLWFMARRGYTLQKCRKQGVEFVDLEKDLKDFREREFKACAEVLKGDGK